MLNTSDLTKRPILMPLLATLVLFALAALLLHQQGRLWICTCGQVLLWAGDIWSADNSQHLFDPYSFTHVLHGFLFFWLLAWLLPRLAPAWQLWLALLIEASWEVAENSAAIIDRYREATLALGYNGDTVINSLTDILLCGVGFWLARKLGWKRTLAIFILTEVILAIWIRDGLLLNILMLIHPIPAIKQWQMPK
ncbi:MAG: DUF2585 family protein [Caldilineaceae bacterium]